MTGKRTVEEYIDYLRYEKRYSPHTLMAYRGDLRQCGAFLSDQYQIGEWTEVLPMHIRSWVYELAAQQLERKSINRKISTLRSFFQFLKKEGQVPSNPVVVIQSMKTSRQLPEVIPEETLKNYFIFTEETTWPQLRDRMLIALLYETGMRRSELIALEWQAVNLKAGYLIVTGKRDKQRQIPLRTELVSQLQEYRKRTAEHFEIRPDFVMVSDRGLQVYPKWVYNTVRTVLGKWASSRKISPHVLRHSIATHLLDAGADIQVIRELLGHASLAATEIYTHNSIEKLKQSYKKALPDLDAVHLFTHKTN